MKVAFLGTGTSVGVPRIGCQCAVCRSPDPRNKRLRSSILVQHRGCHLLVDTTPDLRAQALRAELSSLDAVLFTHGHADHLHGLDDVRCLCLDRDTPLPCYADRRTIERIAVVFDYAFQSGSPSSVPALTLCPIEGPFDVCGLHVVPVLAYHGRLPVLGFRLGGFAYVTDCSHLPQGSLDLLAGLDTLVLDALRDRPHPTHFSLQQALGVVRQLKPRRAFFTHIAHQLDHERTNASLPDHVRLAYDGLTLEFP